MPSIVIASPKGGSGKSTTAVILATELAFAGASVSLLDCDPNQSVELWSSKSELPDGLSVVTNVGEADIVKKIKQLDQDGHIVIIDLEGVASRLVSRAISQADLVITPMRATTLDATIGIKALQLIREEEEMLGREIAHAVVFTMTRAIVSKQHKGIKSSLVEQGVDVISPSLMERAGFSALFEYGGNLRTMPPQGNMENAIINAQAFAESVYSRLIRK